MVTPASMMLVVDAPADYALRFGEVNTVIDA